MEYRDLFLVLAWRDLRIRYAQTFLGLLWAVLQPLATLLIFTLIFGRAIKVDTGSTPYPVYALCGMLAWSYFAYVLNQSGQSIIGAQEMVKKIYFPRLIIPLSKAATGFVDFAITLLFLIILMIFYDVPVSSNIIQLPVYFILGVMASLGIGVWVSSLTIRYRDFQHVVPFLVQVGLYATPIAYPASLIPDKYQLIYHINPMAGVIEGFRWSILGNESISQYAWISFVVIIILFISSLFYFKRVERIMADIV
jgi:lipopolysaccharide transport system permease protein